MKIVFKILIILIIVYFLCGIIDIFFYTGTFWSINNLIQHYLHKLKCLLGLEDSIKCLVDL